MPLTEWTIAASTLVHDGTASSAGGTLVIQRLTNTGLAIDVPGAEMRANPATQTVQDDGTVGAVTLAEGWYSITYKPTSGGVKAWSGNYHLTAATSWAAIVAALTTDAPVTPSAVTEVNTARDEAVAAAASVNREQPNGVAGLDANGKVYETRLPDRLSDASITARSGIERITEPDTAILTARLAAIAADGTEAGPRTLALRAGTYLLDASVAVPDRVRLVLERGATLRANAAIASMLDASGKSDVRIEGPGTIDLNGLVTTAGIQTNATTDTLTVDGVRFATGGVGAGVYPVNVDGAQRVRVRGGRFEGVARGVRVYKAARDVRIEDCAFSDWGERGIFVLGTATEASSDLHIRGVRFANTTTAAATRQPIGFQGAAGARHVGVRISDCVVEGTYTAHHVTTGGAYGAEVGGTADAISLHWCEDFRISGCEIRGSGEVGITTANGTRRGLIQGNTIVDSNAVAIAIGSATAPVEDISAQDNLLVNNGREWSSTPRRAGTDAAIWVQQATGGFIHGNTCVDDQGAATQAAVTYLKNSTGVTVGDNARRGGTTAVTSASSGGNTGTAFRITHQPPVVMAADLSLVDTTQTSTGLSFAVDANAVYEVEIPLVYAASQANDLAVKWSAPAGSVIPWTIDGPPSTNTNGNGATAPNRNLMNVSTTAIIGGGGSAALGVDLLATIRARITTSATAGTVTLTAARNASTDAVDSIIRSAGTRMYVRRVG